MSYSVPFSNLELLRMYHFDRKCRLGSKEDGGYVIAELENGYDCYISAGVSNEESFSGDFIRKYNLNEYNSFAFDGTIQSYPYNYTKNISFIQKNINSFNDDNNTNLSHLIEKYNNIFLKMDIEGCEFPWLLNMSETQLNKFKQITIEFHGIVQSYGWNVVHSDKIKCLEKLSNTHYIVHAHGNNCSINVNGIPDVIEITYVNKKYFNSIPEYNATPLPIAELDFKNLSTLPDVNLNFYPFVTHTQI